MKILDGLKRRFLFLTGILAAVCICLLSSFALQVRADSLPVQDSEIIKVENGEECLYTKYNAESGYSLILMDDGSLLSEDERLAVIESMDPITGYTNVSFVTTSWNVQSASEYASLVSHSFWGEKTNQVLFLIDMDNRQLRIFADGEAYEIITSGICNTITDNVYQYATDGEYKICATKVFEQILDVYEGRKIAAPMKNICNGLLAILMAMLVNFGIVNWASRLKRTSTRELLAGAEIDFTRTPTEITYKRESKVYSPVQKSTGGGSSSGGSSHGGGSSSGGGGGHSF